MRPLRFALNVAGLVLFPAFAAGALTFAAIDRIANHLARSHDQLTAGIASETESWLATHGDPS